MSIKKYGKEKDVSKYKAYKLYKCITVKMSRKSMKKGFYLIIKKDRHWLVFALLKNN